MSSSSAAEAAQEAVPEAQGEAVRLGRPSFARNGSALADRLDLSDTSKASIAKQNAAVREAEAVKRGKELSIPTDPHKVQLMLRDLGHPICFFGERPADRRKRLTVVLGELFLSVEEGATISAKHHAALSALLATGEEQLRAAAEAARKRIGFAETKQGEAATVYSRASAELINARRHIAAASFQAAATRLHRLRESARHRSEVDTHAARVLSSVRSARNTLSQVVDPRPVSACSVASTATFDISSKPSSSSSNSSSSSSSGGGRSRGTGVIAVGAWSGAVSLWGLDGLTQLRVLRGHTERVTGVDMRPGGSISDDGENSTALIASGGCDSLIHLWSGSSDTPISSLRGHAHRVSRVAWHPGGQYLASTSFDTTWRLWDVETGKELLLQDGHGFETYPVAFHPDGSLCATGDLGGIGRVWDLRSGSCVFVMKGHAKQLVSLDMSPNGFSLASGSEDHSVMVWDLRSRHSVCTLPAHTSLVSSVKFAPGSGEVLVSSSYDGSVKCWGMRDFECLSVLEGHTGRVMGVDITADDSTIVSIGWDRTVKLWQGAAS
jgi:U4/U6 small nuclear ribonucleoprotein PRP4